MSYNLTIVLINIVIDICRCSLIILQRVNQCVDLTFRSSLQKLRPTKDLGGCIILLFRIEISR